MNRIVINLGSLLVIVLMLNTIGARAQKTIIPIVSKNNALVLQTDKDQRLRTIYFGEPLVDVEDYKSVYGMYRFNDGHIGITNAAYTPAGTWNMSTPAIQVKHADGNRSLELIYESHQVQQLDANVSLTSIVLKDPVYPLQVTMYYKVYANEDVFEQWTEIKHEEKKSIQLERYSSANMYFTNKDFYLTTFSGTWAKELEPDEIKLTRGIKTFESKLGTRALLLQSPNFILSFNQPASENEGSVMVGQIAWSGNFKLDFEVDGYDNLRFLSGINDYNSEYTLQKGKIFKTPSLIYTVSHNGTGLASRNLHAWARKYQVLDGEGERLTLLNNWEATYFDFDQEKLVELFKGAKELGVDLFLLDDGWFGNKHPRNAPNAGLGDWEENKKKLPDGIGYLVKEARKEGVKFGIWIEPEMVNPKSELYEKHPDWVVQQPNRPQVKMRSQLVLDLANPEVQDYVFNVVDRLFTENPDLAFIKWDCNSIVYNAYSPYLAKKGLPQSHYYVEYVQGLYKALERIRAKYKKVPMMLCAGGGGRGDYALLKYFTEFWPSDNTDPQERVYMQWNYSYFYPSITTDNHVTNWSDCSLKYKVDVACMGKLGFDIETDKLSEKEMAFCKKAIGHYHGYKNIIWHGDLYRLVSPFEAPFAALMYVNKDKSRAIFFEYLVNDRHGEMKSTSPIVLNGLHADKKYRVKEINVFNEKNVLSEKIYSGDFLMKVGLNTKLEKRKPSVVLEIQEIK
ncbi:MAG: alpha-galactosidase [Carboxylicivirga sp.]|nr:alpha-galactosidase [Carboxylicivirga sp.]